MSADPPKQGLFSSISIGRSPRLSKQSSETLTHPLLGASTSSLNLSDSATAGSSYDAGTQMSPSHARQVSGSRNASGSGDVLNVPYKPRQRGAYGASGSISSITVVTGGGGFGQNVGVSPPVTPTGVSAAPTTSTSTSATFSLPVSASDRATQIDTTSHLGTSSTATVRLQVQSLKAAAQRLGLSNGSIGMSMIDFVYDKGLAGKSKMSEDWADVFKALTNGKAVLLLPGNAASNLNITAQMLRDHVAFISPVISLSHSGLQSKNKRKGSSSDGYEDLVSVLVTLSGLVGTIRDSMLNIESALSVDSPLFLAVRNPAARAAALSTLRPTTLTTSSSSAAFPAYNLSTETTILPFPPLSKGDSSADAKESKAAAGKFGRINPFASFFGSSASSSPALGGGTSTQPNPRASSPSKSDFAIPSPDRPLSPAGAKFTPPAPSSPQPSFLSVDAETSSIRSDGTSANLDGYQVTSYAISKPIRYEDVNKALVKAVRSVIREELSRIPDKIVDRVLRLVIRGACPNSASNSDSKSDSTQSLQLDFSDPTSTGEKIQDFMEGVYDDLVVHFRADSSQIFAEGSPAVSRLKRKASRTISGHSTDGTDSEEETEELKKERREKTRRERDAAVEKDATEGTERVEGVLSRLLYNRLFSPLESDDSRHDEALSSRIAALNMLDLSLDHLGLITRPTDLPPGEEGVIASGLSKIVDQIGEHLQKLSLPSCLTPKEKSDVLIAAHKLVVDGLGNLPRIELRPEGEPYVPPPRSASPQVTVPPPSNTNNNQLESPSPEDVALASSSPAMPVSEKALGKPTSSGSTPLSTSPASSDPLTTISEATERTPPALRSASSTSVPQLVLPDTTEPSRIGEAISDSVLTLTAPLSRGASPSSQASDAKPTQSNTSGADLILPIIIYAVVKSNPPQLASQLQFLRRYRSAICLTGEASYAIVNLTAVVEFLEHVELTELGLGTESGKVISVEDLSPIGLSYLDDQNADAASIASASSRLRGRVFQVGEFAGSAADSANKVLTGVVDSSWSALRGLIASPNPNSTMDLPESSGPDTSNGANTTRPRQASNFSLASVTASVATIAAAAATRSRSRANSRASAIVNAAQREEHTWKGNEEMMDVSSRPESIREKPSSDYPSSSDDESGSEDDTAEYDGRIGHRRRMSDARSVKSTSSAWHRDNDKDEGKDRVSIGDRLASIGVLGRRSTPAEAVAGTTTSDTGMNKPGGFLAHLTAGRSRSGSQGSNHVRRVSLLGGNGARPDLSSSSAGSSASLQPATTTEPIEPPIDQFMTCELGDIRLSDIGVLLRDYRRLGNIVNTLNATNSSASRPPAAL